MAKGYSLDALVQERWSRYTTPIGVGLDLNSYNSVEVCGIYMITANSTANTILNIPAKVAGTLEVLPWSTTTGCVIQRYTTYNTATVWNRSWDGTNWTEWKRAITARDVFDVVYPIGIVLQFDNATNPNNIFTGTVWEQIVDGRAARAATGPETGSALGQIGAIIGSDTSTLSVSNLPGHTHGMQSHTHAIASHTHTMAHTHSINHDHGAVTSSSAGAHTHTVSGTAASNGNHNHNQGVAWEQGSDTQYGSATIGNKSRRQDWLDGGNNQYPYTSTNGAHTHSVSGTAASAGAHTHSVDLPNFSGTSGGSSAGNTGGTSLTTGGPSNNTTTSTGDGTSFDVRNASHYYAFWKRTA